MNLKTTSIESLAVKSGLDAKDLEKISELFASHPRVDKVVIFGSRATGDFRPGSDIDLAVYGCDFNFDDLLEIKVGLSDLQLPYFIDVVRYDKLKNDELKARIEEDGIPLP